jgi:hypothetical protein
VAALGGACLTQIALALVTGRRRRSAGPALATGAGAIGAAAAGAVAVGALSIGALAISRVAVRSMRVARLRIGRLEIGPVMRVPSSEILGDWPQESREAARLVIEKHGEPHEVTESLLIWYAVGPWKRVVASRAFTRHQFPVPHVDAVESVIDYRVPVDKIGPVVSFDGSVTVERTAGEVSARCHDEEANLLALNLMHDIVTGKKTVTEARRYYAQEFIDHRRNRPTPYMRSILFRIEPGDTGDADESVLSDKDLAGPG